MPNRMKVYIQRAKGENFFFYVRKKKDEAWIFGISNIFLNIFPELKPGEGAYYTIVRRSNPSK